jgi:F-type H+-transporting ATPase subunit epsilon
LQSGEEQIYYISGGFLEVQPYTITVLADTALRADDVDEAAALQVQQEVKQALANRGGGFDYSQAAARLAEATAQLRTLRQLRAQLKGK